MPVLKEIKTIYIYIYILSNIQLIVWEQYNINIQIGQRLQRKENYKQVWFMNSDVNILNKILVKKSNNIWKQ